MHKYARGFSLNRGFVKENVFIRYIIFYYKKDKYLEC